MAKVTLIFEDTGKEGDASISYEGDPEFEIDGDQEKMTAAQYMAAKAIEHILDFLEDDEDCEVLHKVKIREGLH